LLAALVNQCTHRNNEIRIVVLRGLLSFTALIQYLLVFTHPQPTFTIVDMLCLVILLFSIPRDVIRPRLPHR